MSTSRSRRAEGTEMVLHQPQVQRRKIEVRSYSVARARTRNQVNTHARVPFLRRGLPQRWDPSRLAIECERQRPILKHRYQFDLYRKTPMSLGTRHGFSPVGG